MSDTSRIDAVIFDFGGVITSSPFEAFEAFERANGLPTGFLRRVNATDPDTNAWARLERTEIDLPTFDRAFADESEALGHRVDGARVIALLGGTVRPEMVQALRRLRERVKIGCITNNHAAPRPHGVLDPVDDKRAALALFHHVIESAKIGIRKPDPRIYRMMLDALSVAPERTAFLDDLGVNLKPARQLGMFTIKVGEAAPALDELEALVGFPLR